MLDQHRVAARSEDKRDDLFMERYERLLSWALRLTNQHRASAEDLVQDAFIQFTRGRTSLDAIENIDGYLRRMLKYMHLARLTRHTQQLSDSAMSIADYDSFNLGWRSIEIHRRLQAQEELRQICRYACIRKQTSRAGGVLILRFFHDYFPSEIARILCRSRHCVDELQRLARIEVKLYLDDPRRLKFAGAKPVTKTFQTNLSGVDGDLITELRQMIFNSRESDCLSREQLQEIYESGAAKKLTTAKFGHIVSCYACLDDANRILGLPLLAERYQVEGHHEGSPPNDKSSGDGSGGSSTDLKQKLEERRREVVEHQPQELRVLVNGAAVSSLKVSSEGCEFDLNLNGENKVRFVEILSEQNVPILFFSINQTAGPNTEQWAQIELSERRTVEAILRQNTLSVIYKATADDKATASESLKLVAADAIQSIGDGTKVEACLAKPLESSTHPRTGLFRIMSGLKVQIHKTILRYTGHTEAFPDLSKNSPAESRNVLLLGQASQLRIRPLWARPEFLTTLVSIVLIAALLLLKISTAPTLTATRLLERAAIAEETEDRIHAQVTHRLINLEERRSGGEVSSRRKIETWEDFTNGERSELIYDENNRLLAERWRTKNGTHVVYNHETKQQPRVAKTAELLLTPEEIWQFEPTAKNFKALVGSAQTMEMEEHPASYLFSYGDEHMIGGGRLLKATLTLSHKDLHATQQTLLIERAGEVREYRFVEISFSRLSRKDVQPTVFEPELPVKTKVLAAGNPTVLSSAASNSPVPPSHPKASEELEVEVAYLLNEAKGDRNEQVTLSRNTNGLLRVEGIVDTRARKEELLRALAPVSHNPSVTIDITASSELTPQTRGHSAWSAVRKVANTSDTIAVDRELRDYLLKRSSSRQNRDSGTPPRGRNDQLDEAVSSFSSQTVNRAYRALFHAFELRQVVDRFSNVDMRSVSPDARAKWLKMVHIHGAAFGRECAALRNEVQPVFFEKDPFREIGEKRQIGSDAELTREAERLHKLALSNIDGIRAAFMISSQSSSVSIKSLQFWRALFDAQSLAARIARYGDQ